MQYFYAGEYEKEPLAKDGNGRQQSDKTQPQLKRVRTRASDETGFLPEEIDDLSDLYDGETE
ncbi:MAG: hypothetical protein MMC33_010758, partial [Icmadophila ericetorum]|nr:hypothetical protein [Icmadophila ericetorum]